MPELGLIVLAVFLGLVGVAGAAIFYEQIVQRRLRAKVASLSRHQIDRIYELVESIGTERSRGFVFAATEPLSADGELTIDLPKELDNFPWGGRSIKVYEGETNGVLHFEFVESLSSTMRPVRHRPIAIPVCRTGNKRPRNMFSPKRFLSSSPQLRAEITSIENRHQVKLLALLLSADGDSCSTEPHEQIRVGLYPAWIQSPQYPKCPICNSRFVLVLQFPGSIVAKKLNEATFYIMGCAIHPSELGVFDDWS